MIFSKQFATMVKAGLPILNVLKMLRDQIEHPTMKEIIEEKYLGKILWMRGRYGKEVDENYLKDWRVNPLESGGGIMLDQGIHMLDLFLYLGGEFDEVKSFVSNLYWKISGIEDNVFAIFKNNKTGLCASLHSTMTQWRYLFSLELFLEKGSYSIISIV